MAFQPDLLTTVQLILKEKLKEIDLQHKALLEAMKKLENFMNNVEQNMLKPEVKKSLSNSLKLATQLDVIHDFLSTCRDSAERIVHFDCDACEMFPNETNAHEKSVADDSKTQDTEDSVLSVLKARLVALEDKMTTVDDQALAKQYYLTSKLEDIEAQQYYLTSKLEDMEAKQLLVDKVVLRNDELTTRVIGKDLTTVASQQGSFREDLATVKLKIESLEILRDGLNHANKNVSSRAEIQEKITKIQVDMEQVKIAVANLYGLMGKQENKLGGKVPPSFVATTVSGLRATVGNVIKFSNVKYNRGSCYDGRTSKFTAPGQGLYFFSVSMNTNSNGFLTAAVSCNGATVALCATRGKDFQTGTSVLLELSAGDVVWIEAESQISKEGVEIGGEFSNFLGFQLC